jgi:integrase
MPLKLFKRPKSPNWIMRGTVRGQSIEETTGTTCKETAEAIRIKREGELLTESIWGKTQTMTFAQAALDYVEAGGEKRFLKPLLDHFNTLPLRQIGQEAVDNAAKKLLHHASNATRNRQIYTPMSAILRHAARKGWCKTPIFARPKQPHGVIRYITPDEADILISNCADHLRPLVVFLLYTGARASEALWLDWSQINFNLRQVTFPKTKNGLPRSVPLHPRVLDELSKIEHRSGCIFLTDQKKPYRARTEDDTSAGSRISSGFGGACRRSGIENFSPHDCRHTWATWHYQANHDLTALRALGGWRSTEMVMRYAHTNVSEHARSINALPWGKSGEERNSHDYSN